MAEIGNVTVRVDAVITDEQYHEAMSAVSAANEYIAALEAENAKLRKLVLDVHALHWSGLDCTECPWIGECDTDGGCPWLGIMRDHMADLGIEVPR